MRRRSRLLRVAKWGGVVVCGALLVTFVLSTWMSVRLESGAHLTGVGAGCFGWNYLPALSDDHSDDGWSIYHRATPYIYWLGEFTIDDTDGWAIKAPIWQCLIVVLVPTALFWVWDRRRPLPGHCPCGYDLTGNVSGVCPECGAEAG